MSYNTINVSYMTRTYTNFLKSYEARHGHAASQGKAGGADGKGQAADGGQASFLGKIEGEAG